MAGKQAELASSPISQELLPLQPSQGKHGLERARCRAVPSGSSTFTIRHGSPGSPGPAGGRSASYWADQARNLGHLPVSQGSAHVLGFVLMSPLTTCRAFLTAGPSQGSLEVNQTPPLR